MRESAVVRLIGEELFWYPPGSSAKPRSLSDPDEVSALIHDWDFADFYLLLKSDISWVNDGTRYSGDPGVRDWFFTKLETVLTELNLTFQVVEGKDWLKRETLSKTIVCRYLYECT